MKRCPECGTEGEGNYCASCGTRLVADGAGGFCTRCGGGLSEGALYCSECGAPVGRRPRKPARAYLPWALAGLALIAFSVVIALFVQGASRPRVEGAPLTGGIPGQEGDGAAANPAAGRTAGAPRGAAGSGAMPSAEELAAMSPREAADRLFDRTMQLHQAGDTARARFFADMGVQAYGRVPPASMDADARLHLGLLHLTSGDPSAAQRQAETILAEAPSHPYGLFLALRAAERRGDIAAASAYRDTLRRAVEDEAVAPEAWMAHGAAVERALAPGEG